MSTIFFISLIFAVGYLFITIEHVTKINKATVAILMAVILWALAFIGGGLENSLHIFYEHLASISQIIFFLLAALAIVEIINAHQGFKIVSDAIKVNSKKKLLWTLAFITFFLSAILDNLTTTVVMITLLKKIIEEREDRLLLGSAIVIAANAGGAWTVIGDVTTTMLWIGGQLTSLNVMKNLFIPSMVCLLVSTFWLSFQLKGHLKLKQAVSEGIEPKGKFVFYLGVACLIFVPIFKYLTGLPPFMGMLFGLGVMWLVTDLLHSNHADRDHLRMPSVFTKLEYSGILFFLGILLAISALESVGILKWIAESFDKHVGNPNLIAILIGFASAVVDNVPLVAASMSMYSLDRFAPDSDFWNLIAYSAGVGGSMLIIGSAAGVVFMGLEKVDFFWYFRRISLAAMVGYLAGAAVYMFAGYL